MALIPSFRYRLYQLRTSPRSIFLTDSTYLLTCARARNKLEPTILVLTGFPHLLDSPYTEDTELVPLLLSAIRRLSRETILLINCDRLEWSPSNRTSIIVDKKTIHVSEIDIHGTTTLKTGIKLGTRRGRRRDNFIKVNW